MFEANQDEPELPTVVVVPVTVTLVKQGSQDLGEAGQVKEASVGKPLTPKERSNPAEPPRLQLGKSIPPFLPCCLFLC